MTVICNNLDDRTVYQFRVSDLASVRKAQAVPDGFVVVPKKLMEATKQRMMRVFHESDKFLNCDNMYDAMIAAAQKSVND